MTDFFNEMTRFADVPSRLTVFQAAMGISLSFILALCIAYLNRKAHIGARYSQSFVQTIIIGISVIMIIIGNNVAVGFGDIFIFFGMAVGILCGLGFYILDILFTISLSAIIFVFYLFAFERSTLDKKRLSITVPENLHDETAFDDVLVAHCKYYAHCSVETTNLGTMIQLVYIV